MVQAAILVVLVIIAVVLAPWLLGVAAAAASIYGVYLVSIGAALAVAAVVGVIWGVFSALGSSRPGQEAPAISGERTACRHCQSEVSARLSRCDNCGEALR